jgi:calcineurin-like phosphoesterase family protein
MSRVFMISDLHLGHAAVLKFSKERVGETIEEHDEWLRDQWNSVVYKRDLVYVLGDVAWNHESLAMLSQMNGQKTLIMGNHDKMEVGYYLEYFARIRPSPWSYKGFWLSHCPIHPLELRGRGNIHGHVHSKLIPDSRYVSVCVEALDGVPKLFTEIKEEYDNDKNSAD